MKRKQFAASAAVATPVADFGPDIRRRDVAVPARTRTVAGEVVVVEPGYTREADTIVTQRPDPARPDRQQDIDVAVRWLPHRLHKQGQLSKDELGAASWYRDLIDRTAGTDDRTFGHTGPSDPEKLALVIDRIVDASIMLKDVETAMGVDRATLMRAAVTASTKTDIALAIGISSARVPEACAEVFALLDKWRARNAKGR